MANLSDLTVVILSYQRLLFLVRSMEYWSGKLPTVIILDGTETPVPDEVLNRMAPNIKYNWNPVKYEDRLRSVIPMIQTRYVVQLSDDEFFLPNGLQRCINELETDEELVACVGRCLYFWPRKGRITVMNYYTWWKSILQNSAQERMEETMNTMHALTIYGVVRCENWINCIKVLTEKAFTCCYVTEHQFELFSSYQGKAKIIDVLSWFRSGENHPKSFKNWDRSYHFEHWYRKPENAQEVNELFKVLMKYAIRFDPEIDRDTTEKGFRKAVEIFVTKAESGKTKRSEFMVPFRKFADTIAANLPRKIKYPLKEILGLAKGQFEFTEIPDRLDKMGITYQTEDLKDVERSLQKFYN
jgi:glycosyltransferase domain-containing protein